ncbi:hypothetical protein [Agromyces sp. C10]|uniref:hypothetical protein n=1 Tax=Agromyces sp. C10 TaxID=2935077 RepID=UPI00200B0BC0|nr:hypothetical protein [Agromyces sp. C10]MCK8609191.1 hypothetical protein [Agromyces sp. C10]
MSENRTTQGRLPASVYRRRRAMVLLGLVAVIIAIVLVIVRPGASQGDEVAQTTPASAEPSAPVATAPPSDDPAATPEPAVEPVDGAPCTDAQITVEAVTDAAVYATGEQPQLSVTITNTGPNVCVMNVGTKAQAFTVQSGDEVYWSSTDCQVDPVDAVVSLEPGTPVSSSTPLVWDRTRSSPDTCDAERAAAPGGGASYHLGVTVDGFASETTKQFLLY